MTWKRLKRLLGYYALCGQFDCCSRCNQWRLASRFYYRSDEGKRVRFHECSSCRLHVVWLSPGAHESSFEGRVSA